MANEHRHPNMAHQQSGPVDQALQQATMALQNGFPAEAARIATDVLNDNPKHPGALQAMGCALLMQGRAQEAVAPLEQAARVLRDPAADTQLAIALRQAGHNDDALSRLKRAIKRSPPYAAAFHEMGFLLFTMDRTDEAVEVLRRGLEVAPMMPQLSIQLGNVLHRRGDRADAKSAYSRALDIVPDSTEALAGMALAHMESGEFRAAADWYRRLLRIQPKDAGVWLRLGHCLLELGETESGYDCFRTAAHCDPNGHGGALTSLVKSGRGRFWIKPSSAARFFSGAAT